MCLGESRFPLYFESNAVPTLWRHRVDFRVGPVLPHERQCVLRPLGDYWRYYSTPVTSLLGFCGARLVVKLQRDHQSPWINGAVEECPTSILLVSLQIFLLNQLIINLQIRRKKKCNITFASKASKASIGSQKWTSYDNSLGSHYMELFHGLNSISLIGNWFPSKKPVKIE